MEFIVGLRLELRPELRLVLRDKEIDQIRADDVIQIRDQEIDVIDQKNDAFGA